jgi:choline dehydrogenase-like flavoprotein
VSESTVAIIGSGVAAAAIASVLSARGVDVQIFEKGPSYPYPYRRQFEERVLYRYDNPAYRPPAGLQGLTQSGSYAYPLNEERRMVTGGSATAWAGITLRMIPHDFATRNLYGFGQDWPLAYADLEPFYCAAERFLGVSGTDADNPFAPPRSRPYPLAPFPLSYDDRLLADRLRRHGLALHTTPQARTRAAYGGRPACLNVGACEVCPIGARYSPAAHLAQAQATGRCRLAPLTSVRRIVLDPGGRAAALRYRPDDASADEEHRARAVVVAAGAIESARLLLLSARDGPAGAWPAAGHVGRHLIFHHLWWGRLRYADRLYPGRIGPLTGQSHQFIDPPGRGRHGGIKIEFSSNITAPLALEWDAVTSGAEILDAAQTLPRERILYLHAESDPSPAKRITLSERRDRFGDPFAHVHYEWTPFDHETYAFGQTLFARFAAATEAESAELQPPESYFSGNHHMGGCRMGAGPGDSVVDAFGRVHGTPNLFVAGSGTFPGSSAVNPTLTIVALALRTAQYLLARVL